jgi:hypothetical protein
MTVAFFHFICLRVTYMTIYKKAANSKTSDFSPFYSSKRIISNLFIVVTVACCLGLNAKVQNYPSLLASHARHVRENGGK